VTARGLPPAPPAQRPYGREKVPMPPPPPLLAANQLLAGLARYLRPPLRASRAPVALAAAPGLVVAGARVGHAALSGCSMFCGRRAAALGGMVQVAGTALRLPAQAWRREVPLWGVLQAVGGRYAGALVLQLAQQAACRQWHGLEARLGRWLLMTHDRAPAVAWPLTQAFLATLLGVRRESITQAAQHLQAQQLIHYQRGQLRLLDRAGLVRVACPCYAQMPAYDAGRTSRRWASGVQAPGGCGEVPANQARIERRCY